MNVKIKEIVATSISVKQQLLAHENLMTLVDESINIITQAFKNGR